MDNPFKWFRQRWVYGLDQEPELDPILEPEQYVMYGVDTPGCNCDHVGMGYKWHLLWCEWRLDQK